MRSGAGAVSNELPGVAEVEEPHGARAADTKWRSGVGGCEFEASQGSEAKEHEGSG